MFGSRTAPTQRRRAGVACWAASREVRDACEANVFGAELLMPEAAVREAWAALRDSNALAYRFRVSALAAQWRLFSFGLGKERPV